MSTSVTADNKKLRIAHLGNSMQYYNDTPRLLERLLKEADYEVFQNCCLRGGADLSSLYNKGSTMERTFTNSPNGLLPDGSYDIGAKTIDELLSGNSFDFAIINDHTQSPARVSSRLQGLQDLQGVYGPLLKEAGAVPIIIQTFAYRVPDIRDTEDLGDFDNFTKLVRDGLKSYVKFLSDATQREVLLAPVGDAVSILYHNNKELWNKIYCSDEFHPSPHGTWLQVCILFMKITGKSPPPYQDSFWDRARFMQPPNQPGAPLPLPTKEEADVLVDVALQACDLK